MDNALCSFLEHKELTFRHKSISAVHHAGSDFLSVMLGPVISAMGTFPTMATVLTIRAFRGMPNSYSSPLTRALAA